MTNDPSFTSPTAPPAPPRHGWVRSLVLYAGLVGLPSLGVAGIVRVGERITPPLSVGGRWDVTVAPRSPADAACAGPLAGGTPTALVVAQSGGRVTVALGEPTQATGDGALAGVRLAATLAAAPNGTVHADGCDASTPLVLSASIDGDGSARRMTGELARPGCASCAPVPFHAARSVEPKR